MSVIQDIREKYAKWAVVAIALSLLGFILTDYLSTRSKLFGGSNTTTIGVVNGTKIDYIDFENRLKILDQQMEAQTGASLDENARYQNIERLWLQEIEEIVLGEEFDKLGINVGRKELNDYLFGANPPADLKQRFTNEQGVYDAAAAQQTINQLRRSSNKAERDQLESYLNSLEYGRKTQKINSLLANSIYYPTWYIEKQNAEASGVARVEYAIYPFSRISDTTITVSDKEIQDYIKKHKDQFKEDESRSISYIIFDAAPSSADSAEIRNRIASLKEEFSTTEEPVAFLARNGSTQNLSDDYVAESAIQAPDKDSITTLPKNAVYGPYLEGGNYVLAKMLDSKVMPDSVKARHILIQTADPRQGIQILDDSTAKKRIDSIETAIRGGARFDSLAVQYSDDKSSAVAGGLLSNPSNPATNYFTAGTMVKEFNDFCFEGKTGEMKVVKTVFGYHLIDILDQKNFEPHYKIAYYSRPVIASDETDQQAQNAASRFANESRDLKSFDENYEKELKPKGYQKLAATLIRPASNVITGINYGPTRQLVKKIYDADLGDVLAQERVGDKYIVAAVTEVIGEGTKSVETARSQVEPLLRNKKKSEQIIKNIGKQTSLEAAARAMQDSVKTIDSLRFTGGGTLGYEPKVLGAAFFPGNKGTFVSELLSGTQGVYALRVDETSATSVILGSIEEQKKALRDRAKQMASFMNTPAMVMRDAASVKDYRRKFY